MALTDLQRASFRHHIHSQDQVIDDEGDPIDPGVGVTAQHAFCSTSQSIGSNNTWIDAPGMSLSLAAGTYILIANVTFLTVIAVDIGIRIVDSTETTTYASGGCGNTATNTTLHTAVAQALVVLGSATTVKVQGIVDTGTTNTVIRSSLTPNGVGDNASSLMAIKIA